MEETKPVNYQWDQDGYYKEYHNRMRMIALYTQQHHAESVLDLGCGHGKMRDLLGFKTLTKRAHTTSNAVVVQHIQYRRIIVKQGIVHNAKGNGSVAGKIIANFFVEKGKPVTTPAPAK